ncbi:MAG TPA: RibD family protein [Chloroflexia bacterium]|nr:RibD family protein [Chloroflexia bacterium]
MLPRVIIHTAISADGRMEGFNINQGLYYSLIPTWQEEATLAGSETILKATLEISPDEPEETDFIPSSPDPADARPLLVVVDSRGRIRSWQKLRQAGYWRQVVALCSGATPETYLAYLKARHIDTIVAGEGAVDLRTALEELHRRYGVKVVRVDSGGILNGVLLRGGLVDEVSILLHPCLVGGTSPGSFFKAPDLTNEKGAIPLQLVKIEQLEGEVIWLRYNLLKEAVEQ